MLRGISRPGSFSELSYLLEEAILPIATPQCVLSASVDAVIADIHAPNDISLQIKNRSKIGRYFDRINRFTVNRRKPVDLMRSQPRVEGILFENLECRKSQALFLRRQFGQRASKDLAARKRYFTRGA